ncbi:glycosyltransferase family 2 protein [Paenarthrobacter nitroguajacolicus]|uniref:glycosyltransferase family 2 protein n=1 Tax=Paenarthrobacter nitroguajacolicus TaxID=211146 RepID=UPI0015BFA0B4
MSAAAPTSTELISASVVIPSLSPNAGLLRLLQSLELQRFTYSQIIIVDQSLGLKSRAVLENYEGSLRPKIQIIESEPGLAKARNAGLSALRDGWDVVLLPDDDVWLDGDVSESVTKAIRQGVSAGSGRLDPENGTDGLRIDFPDKQILLTQGNVWRSSIEACYFLTPHFLKSVGMYDESLGLGAKTPWQSGEGTDLLLRGLERGLTVVYLPGYKLVEATMPTLSAEKSRRRLRNYARGTGRVFARNYSLAGRCALLIRSAGRVVLQTRRGREAFRDNWQILVGRVEGITGKIL